MSLYFDLVINCDLREDTPEAYINAIRYWTDPGYELDVKPELIIDNYDLWKLSHDRRFLATNPNSDMVSSFQRRHRTTIPLENNREVYRYCLQYCGRWLHDDGFYDLHLTFLDWLGTIAEAGFIGYYRETSNSWNEWTHLLFSRDRQLVLVDHARPDYLNNRTTTTPPTNP